MPMYVVERDLPGITEDQLTGAGLRTKSCVEEMSREGQDVRWVRSYFSPDTEQARCYYEASDEDRVKELNERAQVPYVAIRQVMEMTPEAV